ncbi:hypothetical protein AB4Z52_07025 [Rhizobium sp. 2YAF20]|uniref:hypothetical protein n=1 Tax=Rhizobium sp. 2YAF20 TaxID=3233027 RepID=UPI003F96514F
MWGIAKGLLVFAAGWWLIFKVSDWIQGLPWVERRRLKKALEAADKWPPKRPLHLTPATYRVFYSDSVVQEVRLTSEEIHRWAIASNALSIQKTGCQIVRIEDESNSVVWRLTSTED